MTSNNTDNTNDNIRYRDVSGSRQYEVCDDEKTRKRSNKQTRRDITTSYASASGKQQDDQLVNKHGNEDDNNNNDNDDNGIFSEISLSGLLGGSLAAVTSLLLAQKIGVTGSVIGAIVSYVVSTISGTVYKNALKKAENGIADKIKGSEPNEPDIEDGERRDESSEHCNQGMNEPLAGTRTTGSGLEAPDDNTTVSSLWTQCDAEASVYAHSLANPDNNERLMRIARERSVKKKKMLMIAIPIIMSIVALLFTVLVINGATDGEGLGTKPTQTILYHSDDDSTRYGGNIENTSSLDSDNASNNSMDQDNNDNANASMSMKQENENENTNSSLTYGNTNATINDNDNGGSSTGATKNNRSSQSSSNNATTNTYSKTRSTRTESHKSDNTSETESNANVNQDAQEQNATSADNDSATNNNGAIDSRSSTSGD